MAFAEPTTALFLSQQAHVPQCEGFGPYCPSSKVIPNKNLSMRNGLIAPWRTPAYREMNEWM